jgi:hypothetical protein
LEDVRLKGLTSPEVFKAGYVCSVAASVLSASKRLVDIDDIIDLPELNFDPNVSAEEYQLIELETKKDGSTSLQRLRELIKRNRQMYRIVCSDELLENLLLSICWLEAGLGDWDAGWSEDLGAKEGENLVMSKNGGLLRELAALVGSSFERLKRKDCQFDFYGKEHLWILKPGTSSRGRGIEVFSRLDKILARRSENRKIPWIVQKYMENSLLIRGRKFDIRQWVGPGSADSDHRLEPADRLVLRRLLRALRLPNVHLRGPARVHTPDQQLGLETQESRLGKRGAALLRQEHVVFGPVRGLPARPGRLRRVQRKDKAEDQRPDHLDHEFVAGICS